MAVRDLTPKELSKQIGGGSFKPVYYFYGEEDFRKVEAIKFILNHYIPQAQRLMNFTRFTVDKTDFETICAELAAIPMLGERRLIHIDEIQKLKPTQQKQFFALLATPIPETMIILSTPAARTPKKNVAFFKNVVKIAAPVVFRRLQSDSARSRIEKQLKTRGLTYDREAIDLLISITDGNYGGLMGELEKLSLMSDEGGHIGLAEMEKLASSYEDFNIFTLIDLIAEKQTDRALYTNQDLILKGTRPASIPVMLAGHMMKLLLIHTGKKVAGAPFYISKLKAQARIFDREKVLAAITLIAAAEHDIRRSKLNQVVLVENLIREISR